MKLTTPIATGNTAVIYLADGRIVKVFTRHSKADVEHEAANQEYARLLGLPVPGAVEITEYDGKSTLVMERAPGVPMKDLLLEDLDRAPILLAKSVEIQRRVHALAAPAMRRMSDRLRQQIDSVDRLDGEEKSALTAMLDGVRDETQLCHGDLHVQNLVVDGDNITIIDWNDATRGNPLLDACRTYVLYAEVDAGFAGMYLHEYCRQSGVDGEDVLRWEPVMRAARMSES